LEVVAERLLVDVGVIAADHPRLAQRAHPGEAGGLRNPGLLGEVLVGDAGVVDERAQDGAIGGVERPNILRRAAAGGNRSRRRKRHQGKIANYLRESCPRVA